MYYSHFLSFSELVEPQKNGPRQDRKQWKDSGCKYVSNVWCGPNSNPCFPKCLLLGKSDTWKGLCIKGGDVITINCYWYKSSQVTHKCFFKVPSAL